MIQKKTLPVIGMACAVCAGTVERILNGLDGVNNASVSLAGRTALVEYDDDVLTLEGMKAAVNAGGFDLVIEQGRSVEQIRRTEYVRLAKKTALAWIIMILVVAVGMRWVDLGLNADYINQTCMILSLAAMIVCGKGFYIRAWRQVMSLTPGMDTLVALSTLISFLFSVFNTFWGESYWGCRGMEWHTFYDAVVMIITFVLTGRLIEERAKNGMASALRRLAGMTPKTARLVTGDSVDDVPLSTISISDVLEVTPGDKIPVDGTVTEASSLMSPEGVFVDESMITGEPAPVLKKRFDKLLAGTVLKQGHLRMRATQVGEKTALAQIISMVEQAQASKAPVQRIVDKMAMYFVPMVLGLSIVTFLLWMVFGGKGAFPQALMSAVTVLVIACPCALGLATPTAIMVGIGVAARNNILIKDAVALEMIHRVGVVVIDKTGTITKPNPDIDFSKADTLPLEERESLKPYVRETIDELSRRGIRVIMMSGDNDEAVAYWADKAGITEYRSRVTPQDKEDMVKRQQADGIIVAMTGDGINDTQALAAADVSISIGGGTDVAVDTSQLTLMGDDLRALSVAMTISDKTVLTIRQNLFWAFIYNIISIPLAAGLLRVFGMDFQLTPSLASGMMAMSSISVVLNSLLLRFMRL
ncbi:MAG: heavy metal translocating P-type ATPase [Prevotella sp.]|nr:heavy metal translocating P-type ATPase [Prevotella sp.]